MGSDSKTKRFAGRLHFRDFRFQRAPQDYEVSVGETGFRRRDRPDLLFWKYLQVDRIKQGVGGSRSGAL